MSKHVSKIGGHYIADLPLRQNFAQLKVLVEGIKQAIDNGQTSGNGGGSGLTLEQLTKLNSVETGAQKNPTFKTVNGQSITGTGDISIHGLADYTGKKLAAFGDSITSGTEGGYVKYLQEVLGVTVTNKGSSGATASRMFDIVFGGLGVPRRDTVTASTSWPLVDYGDFDVITIQIGTNNIESNLGSINNLPTSTLDQNTDLAAYLAQYDTNFTHLVVACVRYIQFKNPSAEIHLITPPHRHRANGDTATSSYRHREALKPIAQLLGVNLIDAIGDSGITWQSMSSGGEHSYDGTHFNVAGNAVWGTHIANAILANSGNLESVKKMLFNYVDTKFAALESRIAALEAST